MKENDATGRKRRKIIYFHEKILKNEKCADFYADIAGPVGKNMIFYRFFTVGSTDISAKNCTTFVFMFFFHEKIYNLLIFLRFLPLASFSFIFINFRSTFYKIIIWAYNSPLRPCQIDRKLNFKKDCLIFICLSHGKCYFMKFF